VGAWLNSAAGLDVAFVHYKGTAPMLQDLVAGRIQLTTGSIATSSPFVKSGKLRPIALLGKDKTDLMPGMKTVGEQGLPDFDYSTWTGLVGPAGMPSQVVAKLSTEIARIAKTSEMTSMFAKDGTLAVGSSPAEFRKFLIAETTNMKRVAQAFNIKAIDE
jgi:tripartite-type tricarboxylate transporter receptor subunit TctC